MGLLDLMPLRPLEAVDFPEGPALYLLWRDRTPIYAGCVTDATNIRDRVLSHFILGEAGENTPVYATHFSCELTSKPLERLEELTGTDGRVAFDISHIRSFDEGHQRRQAMHVVAKPSEPRVKQGA
jgi:hypothetical protein